MASTTDIGVALDRLVSVMPPPRGVKNPQKAFDGYVVALKGFSADEIDEAITRYLSAEWPDISLKFYPRAPELAHLCRMVRADHSKVAEKEARAEQAARERIQEAEADQLRLKTPQQKARARAIYDGYVENVFGERERQARARVERDRAESRARYGMSPVALEAIPDRKQTLPKGMRQAGDAAPGIPEPQAPANKPEDFGGLS